MISLSLKQVLQPWFFEFVYKLNDEQLLDLFGAAHFLHIPALLNLLGAAIVSRIESKWSPELVSASIGTPAGSSGSLDFQTTNGDMAIDDEEGHNQSVKLLTLLDSQQGGLDPIYQLLLASLKNIIFERRILRESHIPISAAGDDHSSAFLPYLHSPNVASDERMANEKAASLPAYLSSLTSLYLTGNDIDDAEASSLAATLPSLTSLTSLNLSHNGLRDAGAASIAVALPSLTSLRSLNLSYNDIGAIGAASLAAALPSLTSLRRLHFEYNRFFAAGATSLAAALPSLTSLTSLNLSHNNIGDEGAASLAEALPALTVLKSLNLENNRFTASGAASLAATLPSLSYLNDLQLINNVISDADVLIGALIEGYSTSCRWIAADSMMTSSRLHRALRRSDFGKFLTTVYSSVDYPVWIDEIRAFLSRGFRIRTLDLSSNHLVRVEVDSQLSKLPCLVTFKV